MKNYYDLNDCVFYLNTKVDALKDATSPELIKEREIANTTIKYLETLQDVAKALKSCKHVGLLKNLEELI